MSIILNDIKGYDIVVDGVSPAEDADLAENHAYDHLCHTTSPIVIQMVSLNILEKIVELDNHYRMRTWLRTKYYRDSALAFVTQIMNLVSFPTQNSGTDLPGFISKHESQWLLLTKLSKAASNWYRETLAAFLNEDKAKRDILLGFLIKNHDNVVDNLTTNDSPTYVEVKQRLIDIDTSKEVDDSSQFVSKASGNEKTGKKLKLNHKSSSSSSAWASKVCTWCKMQNPRKSEGHVWNECFRLGKLNKQKKEHEQE